MRLALLAAGLLAAAPALACRCRDLPPARQLALADAAVTGRVSAVRTPQPGRTLFRVEVDRIWKGTPAPVLEVGTATTCAIPVEGGRRYLLFLRREAGGRWSTDRCSGSRADPAPALLDRLGPGRAPAQ